MEEIIVTIDPKGRTCVIETDGFAGASDCLGADIQAFKAAIGEEEWQELKPEAHTARLTVKPTHRAGGGR